MDLDNLRVEIDGIDDQITELFQKRMAIAEGVAKYKIENALPVLNHARERDIIYRVCSNVDDNLKEYTKILYNTIFDISRTHQSAMMIENSETVCKIKKAVSQKLSKFPQNSVVACQGIEGAYSQQAAEKIFSMPKIMYMRTFDSVFNAVEKGLCDYGILPVENSTAGSVTQVYELMKKYNFHIARSVKLRVHHVLLGKKGADLCEIKEIYSHEQAISQCGEFLKNNPHIKVNVCENTAVAAMIAARSGKKDIAALSSSDCADIYNLAVISDNVQNSDNNYTRFICISKDLEIFGSADKISLIMTLDNKAGALYSVLTKFAILNLNLTKLESRPISGTDFEFVFYFDVDGSVLDEKVLNLIGQLENTVGNFAFLGNYVEVN